MEKFKRLLYMGAVSLIGQFKYIDGSYVEVESVSTVFSSGKEDIYACVFRDIKKSESGSADEVSAECNYLMSNGLCSEKGVLDVSCDIYGVVTNNGYVIRRECSH